MLVVFFNDCSHFFHLSKKTPFTRVIWQCCSYFYMAKMKNGPLSGSPLADLEAGKYYPLPHSRIFNEHLQKRSRYGRIEKSESHICRWVFLVYAGT